MLTLTHLQKYPLMPFFIPSPPIHFHLVPQTTNDNRAENIVTMEADKELLTGDVLLASAFISYVGPFTKVFRDRLMANTFTPFLKDNFRKALGEEAQLPLSDSADPVKILTNSAEVAAWGADGLPADMVSIENGCIVTSSARWPLIIDPQLQGIKWLKQKESGAERNLQVVRLGQNDMLRKLERALENGTTILIENIGESLDAVLNPGNAYIHLSLFSLDRSYVPTIPYLPYHNIPLITLKFCKPSFSYFNTLPFSTLLHHPYCTLSDSTCRHQTWQENVHQIGRHRS